MKNLWLDTIEKLDINDTSQGICHALEDALPYTLHWFWSFKSSYYHQILECYFKDVDVPYWAGCYVNNAGKLSFYCLSDEETYWRRVNICLLMHEMHIRGEI